MRVLFADGHESHITGNFLSYYKEHNIQVLRLPPHSSHLLQPLDVGIFGPLKKSLSKELNPLRMEISRVRKVEWLNAYIRAHKEVVTVGNIWSSWQGAGIVPFNPSKVLRHLLPLQPSLPLPLSPSMALNIFDTTLLTSSPPDAVQLHTANFALKTNLHPKNL